jgi:5-methylcytosine-specific restriction endonuclease McrA
MNNVANKSVLLLNASYEAIAFAPMRKAVKLIVKQRAKVEEHLDYEIYVGIPFPTVVRLLTYVHIPIQRPTLSRKSVLLRDRHRCQYCGKRFSPAVLTLDHIIPKCRGGRESFENLVACCGPCNRKKGNKLLEESGMTLLHKPRASNIHTPRFLLRSMATEEDKSWQKYLYFDNAGDTKYSTVG